MSFTTSARLKDRQGLFAPLLPAGALVFDIGANHGEHTATFLSLGARRVVALEPQAQVAAFIAASFPDDIRDGALIVRVQAAGAAAATAKMVPSGDAGKSMSTLSDVFLEVSRANGDAWREAEAFDVEVVTLDALIEEFGAPDYIKIDAEGFDLEVLKGLSRPARLLSFEFNTQDRLIQIAEACINHVAAMGNYEFNYLVETAGQTALQFPRWVSGAVMRFTLLHDIARAAAYGDIFARRVGG